MFIDAQYRSVFAGVIAIGWQTYLSFLNRRAEVEIELQRGLTSGDRMGSEVSGDEGRRRIEA
jgi:protein Mpv17